MPARAACGVPPLLANPSRVSPALLQSQHGATITLTARGSCPLSQPGPPALHPLSCGGFGIPHCRGCSGFVVGLRWGQAPVQSESAAGRLGCGDALGGVTGMPCMGHGDDLYRVMGCPAWGHAPAGRQAAGRGWAVQPQPAGCAPAPHSTRMSHEERPAAGHGPPVPAPEPAGAVARRAARAAPGGGCSLTRTTALSPYAPACSPGSAWWQLRLCTRQRSSWSQLCPQLAKAPSPGAEQPISTPVPPSPLLPSLPGRQPQPSPHNSPPCPRRAE